MAEGSANGNPDYWIKLGHTGARDGVFYVRDEGASGTPDRMIVAPVTWTKTNNDNRTYQIDYDIHGTEGNLLLISGYSRSGGWGNRSIAILGGDTEISSLWLDTTLRINHRYVSIEFGNASYHEQPESEPQGHLYFKAWNGADGYLRPMSSLDQFGKWTYNNVAGAERVTLEPEDGNADSILTLGSTRTTRGYLLVRAHNDGVAVRPGVVVLEGRGGTRAYLWFRESGGVREIRADVADPAANDSAGVVVAT